MSERKKALQKARRKEAKKKSLAHFLDHRNFDYFEEFLDAFHGSPPEEKLKWFAKTLPFMFRREDNTPHIEVGGDIVMNKIESPQKFLEILKSDPFLDVQKLVEGEIINARSTERRGSEVSELQTDSGSDRDAEEGTGRSHDVGTQSDSCVSGTPSGNTDSVEEVDQNGGGEGCPAGSSENGNGEA